MKFRFTLSLMTTCAFGVLATAAIADPPERVGRISSVEGEVSFQPPQESFWTSATLNFPVANGEAFWTGDEGRAELQIGPVAARLDNETELDVVDLDYGSTRLSLAQGSLDLRLWRAPRGGVVIATPAGDVRLDYAGSYRIDVGAPQDDGSYPPVEVTVFEGSAAAPGAEGSVEIDAGEAAVIYAGYDPQAIDVQDAAIDDWARDREQGERWDAYSDQSPGMTGVEDLERYGQFEDTPDYGQVWFPRDVDPDWAPYRYGHWAFVNPWGWTWIDDQPWGFAPFHYGRWAQIDGRWGWIAGRRVSEPVYAPALVAFIGGGDTMGWVALGPDETYRPDYEVSDTYARRLNAANVNPNAGGGVYGAERRNSAGQFRNAQAAVVVRSSAFARGDPVQRAVVPLTPQALASAPIAGPASRPTPTPEARAGVGARALQGGPGPRAGSIAAPPPPTNLEAVRRAVLTHPANSLAPPAIPGATVAPPRSGQGAFVAPSQLRHPDAQARQAPPVMRPSTPLAPAPGVTPPRATPLRSLSRPPQAQGSAPQGEGAPPQAPRPFARPTPGPQSGPTASTPEGAPPPRRPERPRQGSPQPGPAPQPGPDVEQMRAPAAADAQGRRNAAAQAAQQQEQMRLQAEQRAAQQRGQGAPRTAPPNRTTPPVKYRIGPDGKPIPIPPDPRQ